MVARNDITGDELRSTGADFTEEVVYKPAPLELSTALKILIDHKCSATLYSDHLLGEAKETVKKNKSKIAKFLLEE